MSGDDADRYRQIVDAALVGILVIDAAGAITYANPAAAELFGLQPSDMVGRHAIDALGRFPDPSGLAQAERRMVERTTLSDRYELQITRDDGSESVILISSNPLYRADGSFDASVAVMTEITDRVAAESALRRSEHRLQVVMEQLPAVLGTTDADLRLTSSSGAGLARLGLVPNQTNGMTLHEFVAAGGDPDNPIIGHLLRVLQGDEVTWEGEWAGHTYLTHARPLRDEDDAIVGTIYLGLDVNEQKKNDAERALLEAELRQAQKMEAIGRLAGGLAHDFNNLLSAIGGYAEFLLEAVPGGQPREDVEGIRREVKRAASLTRQLLAFSRRQVFDRSSLDLNEIAADMDRLLRRLIGADIELVALMEPGVAAIEADRSQIEQVIVNLAVNARDAMPGGGKLVLETGRLVVSEPMFDSRLSLDPGEYVTLSVRDTGVGMSPETIDRIFEPFFTTKEVGRGTGLGLSTTFGILEQSGAKISVYSERYRGTTFKIFFPSTGKQVELVNEPAAPLGTLRGSETVLLVEDEEVLRALVARTLRSNGYQVVEARYASEALGFLDQLSDQIDLVLSDIVMPGMSGTALFHHLAAEYPRLKVVLMSGYSERVEAQRPTASPRPLFLEKPFTHRALLSVVAAALGQK